MNACKVQYVINTGCMYQLGHFNVCEVYYVLWECVLGGIIFGCMCQWSKCRGVISARG